MSLPPSLSSVSFPLSTGGGVERNLTAGWTGSSRASSSNFILFVDIHHRRRQDWKMNFGQQHLEEVRLPCRPRHSFKGLFSSSVVLVVFCRQRFPFWHTHWLPVVSFVPSSSARGLLLTRQLVKFFFSFRHFAGSSSTVGHQTTVFAILSIFPFLSLLPLNSSAQINFTCQRLLVLLSDGASGQINYLNSVTGKLSFFAWTPSARLPIRGSAWGFNLFISARLTYGPFCCCSRSTPNIFIPYTLPTASPPVPWSPLLPRSHKGIINFH